MFIAIDIGNTNITIGLRQDDGTWEEYRIGSEKVEPLVYYTRQLAVISREINKQGHTIEGVGISSVVPHLTDVVLDATRLELHHDPVLFQSKWYHLLPVTPANPEEIGTDLLANSLAACVEYQGPCLVVDFGTALTYTLVSDKQKIEGVAIAPGIKTAMEALAGNAAQLPEIPLELPDNPLGTNTVEAMNSGILWGFVGQVVFMLDKIRQFAGYPITPAPTGGLSEVLKPLQPHFDAIDRHLTLKGIYHFFKLVQADRGAHHAG